MRQRLGFQLRWTAFPLHPETPHAGRELKELFAAHPGYLEAMWPRLRSAAAELGVVFGERTRTFNSRPACELAKWAEAEGRGWAFHRAIYEAYFGRGENIALEPVLQQAATAAGLDSSEVPQLLRRQEYAAAVDDDWQRCRELGVQAIPTLVRAEERLVGFQPESELLRFFNLD